MGLSPDSGADLSRRDRQLAAGRPGARASAGATYLSVLFLVAALAVGSAAAGTLWTTAVQRERERELLFAGEQFRRAIGSYYESGAGEGRRYPPAFSDLLQDPRHPGVRRHLRRVLRDPMTNSLVWGEVRAPDGGIMGVYSRGSGVPLRQSGFPQALAGFDGAQSYAGWRFVYLPPASAGPASGGGR
jgi:type II secretory pathway pseudopilin PulG